MRQITFGLVYQPLSPTFTKHVCGICQVNQSAQVTSEWLELADLAMVRLKPTTDKELLEQTLQLIEKDKRLAERIDTACDLRHKERLKAGREVNAIRFDLAWVGASLDLESQAIDELTGFLAELLTLPTRDADDIKTFTEGVHLSSAA